MVPGQDQLVTPGSAVRHVTDCVTWPSNALNMSNVMGNSLFDYFCGINCSTDILSGYSVFKNK